MTDARQDWPQLLPSVQAFLRRTPTMLIDGQWVPSADGTTFATVNPADGTELAQVPNGDAEDVDRAVRAARKAFESGPWPRLAPHERARLLWRLGELIDEHADELSQIETLDNGKPLRDTRGGDVPASAEMFRYMAGWPTKLNGQSITYGEPGRIMAYTRHEPIGVVGAITPWNYPLSMASQKLAPALAAGCTVVLKPAEQTPLSALRLGELIMEAGFPPGVVNIVIGVGAKAGAAIAAHHDVDKVSFTGSTAIGRTIIQSGLGNLKRFALELGGKNPSIVLPDADLEEAVGGASRSIFSNAGQICTSGSRLYVQRKMFDDVVAGVADYGSKLRIGAGFDPQTQIGPLVSQRQLERVTGYMEQGLADGANAVIGGRRSGEVGYFVEPTVFTDVTDDMSIVREEIFGPVLTAIPYTDLDDLVAKANDTEYGLAAHIWTHDLSAAHRLAARIRAGVVAINGPGGNPALPAGGFKQSGWGREKGREGIELYTEHKSVLVNL